ncbi:MAG: M4 family metallopeptidase [Lapillicoccus sp.]
MSSRIPSPSPFCTIVPTYLLERIAAGAGPEHPDVPDEAAMAAQRTLDSDRELRQLREVFAERGRGDLRGPMPGLPPHLDEGAVSGAPSARATAEPQAAPAVQRSIYDAKHGSSLPGTLVRKEGAKATSDASVTRAYDGLGSTWQLYWDGFQRDSLDGKAMPLVASVHYQRGYDNAFWDGKQMVFGDGDGTYFNDFTSSVDVIGHELTHGVTQFTAGLTYVAQSGALNESLSDCFGSMVKQLTLGQDAADADWLIGEGLFTAKVKGVALRSMKAPGTAYDDPVIGKDPQPADMDGYVKLPSDAQHDNGGVHTNSGIPNRAFYLAATAIGGRAWEGAGLVWYDVLTGSAITKDVDFAGFAALTIAAAKARFGNTSSQATAVQDAWTTVKVRSATAKKGAAKKATSTKKKA